jgi:hypothetical protein
VIAETEEDMLGGRQEILKVTEEEIGNVEMNWIQKEGN